nr:hypothetical protein CFP56_74348 [Quercus suber]
MHFAFVNNDTTQGSNRKATASFQEEEEAIHYSHFQINSNLNNISETNYAEKLPHITSSFFCQLTQQNINVFLWKPS